MIYKPDEFRFVNFLWDDAVANSLDPVERLALLQHPGPGAAVGCIPLLDPVPESPRAPGA